jgi:hypothetical protein
MMETLAPAQARETPCTKAAWAGFHQRRRECRTQPTRIVLTTIATVTLAAVLLEFVLGHMLY